MLKYLRLPKSSCEYSREPLGEYISYTDSDGNFKLQSEPLELVSYAGSSPPSDYYLENYKESYYYKSFEDEKEVSRPEPIAFFNASSNIYPFQTSMDSPIDYSEKDAVQIAANHNFSLIGQIIYSIDESGWQNIKT
jgi:hypothetical protein